MKEGRPANNKKIAPKQAPQQKANSKPQAHTEGDLINDIFKAAKHKKVIQKEAAAAKKDSKQTKLAQKLKKQWKIEEQLRKASEGGLQNISKVESGIKIYSEEDLKIGQGGNTRLCPIDCNCCF